MYIDDRPIITQAENLPQGWLWEQFQDGSGHLKSPDNRSFFTYDLSTREMWKGERTSQNPKNNWTYWDEGITPLKQYAEEWVNKNILLNQPTRLLVDIDGKEEIKMLVNNNSENKISEQLFVDSKKATFAIYQLKYGAKPIEGQQDLINTVERDNYNFIYAEQFSKFAPQRDRLEEIWERFSIDHFADDRPLIAVGDIIAINDGGKITYHYCGDRDFIKVQEFTNTNNKVVAETSKRNTLVINAFGGPGAGKTTASWQISQQLKKLGFVVEYVPEYAKELVWDEKFDLLDGRASNQIKLFDEQKKRIDRLIGKVDFVVTDSPLLLNLIYLKEHTPVYEKMVVDAFKSYHTFNFIVNRDGHKFEQSGRIQNLAESKEKDLEIKSMLDKYGLYYGNYVHSNIDKIVDNAVTTLGKLNGVTYPVEQQITDEQKLPHGYKMLLEHNNQILACIDTPLGKNYTVWSNDFDGSGVNNGHYFMTDKEAAYKAFAINSKIINQNTVFEKSELVEIYKCLQDTYQGEYKLTAEDTEKIKAIGAKIEEAVPDIQKILQEEFEKTKAPKKVGYWRDNTDVEVYKINNKLYALNGWNGEEYTACWECSGEYNMDASREVYSIRPQYRFEKDLTISLENIEEDSKEWEYATQVVDYDVTLEYIKEQDTQQDETADFELGE